MAHGMNRLNVTILTGGNKVDFWTGTPSQEGGALRGIDMSPVGGPPQWDYDTGGNDREQMKFTFESKIPGADDAAREAYIAKYAKGTVFTDAVITGVPSGFDWIVENAIVKHSENGNTPSMLTITLAETGPTGS